MRIINFYSFKGGVGRSLSLVNIAYQLSQKGQKIGLVDLDVEAGGLNHILDVSVNSGRDLLALLTSTSDDLPDLEEYVHEIAFRRDEAPRVFLLPTISDSNLLDEIRWNESTQRFISDELFPAFRRLYSLDYILIDSRSGLSTFAALAMKIADMEVLVCRLDAQNRYGIRRIVEVCRAASKPFKIVVSACPAEKQAQHIARFEKEINAKIDYVLPYLPDLYYEEFIISKRNPNHNLSKQYLALASAIQNDLQ
jgi:MinD-like ATPase involved in chromosome partitioning or flagellar assembly